ncbi:hypothetical protein Tco_0560588 [Tanacetum coccineum]
MKEILYDRMFQSDSYKSHQDHRNLYDVLEVSMSHDNMEVLNDILSKSSRGVVMIATSDLKQAPSSSLKHKTTSAKSSQLKNTPSESSPTDHTVNDDQVPNEVHLSDSNNTGAAYLPQIKTTPSWLKKLPEYEDGRPETLKPAWAIPPNNIPQAEYNWVDAMAQVHKDPAKNQLLRKTGDLATFIKWYCRKTGETQAFLQEQHLSSV